ncbi:four helix bundle protein [Tepidiforma sp.]|uniref:four helix bundle protein n=1 Tax=Tepidiforma sp. TaxID=2682230 RepID=UPI002ADD9A3E|nr:hypothetical protein [Tepidiforma sp.]
MAEPEYPTIEAWNTAVRLAASIGRLKIGSNLRASQEAQDRAFQAAGEAAAHIAEAATREGQPQVALLREARGALAAARSWLHVLAALTNEPETVFAQELDLIDQAGRQVNAFIRATERSAPAASRPGARPAAGAPAARPPAPRPPGAPR